MCNGLFFISAAGLGASFAGLSRANRYIVNGTFDPKYESSYWIRFFLGLIAGVMLPELIPIENSESGVGTFAKPTLAMLGGFSANFVHSLLNRLVETLESLVKGNSNDTSAVQEQMAKTRSAEEFIQERLQLTANLINLQHQLKSGMSPEQL